MTSAITWEGILVVEGELTSRGDDRYIEPGALTWGSLPIPFRYVRSDVGRHDNAVTVGTIEEIWRDEGSGQVHARGTYDHHTAEGLEAARLAHRGIQPGISIDPDDVVAAMAVRKGDGTFLTPEEMAELTPETVTDDMAPVDVWRTARIRAATQVAIPAFADARVTSVTIPDDLSDLFPDGALTAAAVDFTDSAMIALTPSTEDAERLAHPDGQPPDDLHVTLLFLGDADQYTSEDRDALVAAVEAAAVNIPADSAETWASAHFNPDGDDPCAVYLVGRNPEIVDVRNTIVETAEAALADSAATVPEQHTPWVPHLTIGYGLDPADLTEFGPVTFDAVTLSFGDDDRVVPFAKPSGDEPVDDGGDDDEFSTEALDLAVRVMSGGWCAPSEDLDPDAVTAPKAVTASAIPPHSTAVEDDRDEGDWDGDRVEKALPTGEDPDFYARFYAYQSEEEGHDGTAKDHWHYLHHYVSGSGSDAEVGDASIIACRAIIQLLNGARGVDIVATGKDRETVYDHVAKHLQDGGYEDIPELIQNTTSSAAPAAPAEEDPMEPCDRVGTVTAAAVDIPSLPRDHFTPFDLTEPTPLTLTEDGHVFGHVALDSICHVGMPGCVTMPKSATGLRYFHTGVVRLDDGTDLSTGRITIKGSHAPIEMDWRSAMAHYDTTSAAIADVVAVEDDFGIAVFGHLRPGTPPELVHAFRASTPSGDWRRMGNSAELINVHMVNSPGFPVYREANGRHEASIVAAAFPVRSEQDPSGDIAAIIEEASSRAAEKMLTTIQREAEANALSARFAPDLEESAMRLRRRVLPD